MAMSASEQLVAAAWTGAVQGALACAAHETRVPRLGPAGEDTRHQHHEQHEHEHEHSDVRDLLAPERVD
jgi:hypothetical protein